MTQPNTDQISRVRFALTFNAVAPATSDTLLTTVAIRDGVAAGGATSQGVTAGKILRLTSIEFGLAAGAAATAFGVLTLRQNPSGATVIGSQLEGQWPVGATEATAGAARVVYIPLPDGMEFSGAQTFGLSLSAQAVTNVISIALRGYEYTPLPAQLR